MRIAVAMVSGSLTGAPCTRGAAPAACVPSMRGSREARRSEEHTSELQSLMRISYAVFCLKKKRSPSAGQTSICTENRADRKDVHHHICASTAKTGKNQE